MKSRIILILLALLFWINSSILAKELNTSSGLYFSSHEVVQDKRTSLHLTPKRPFIFKNQFRISYDASFRHGDGYYGLICRFICNEDTNIDLVANTGSTDTNFWLIYKDQVQLSFSFDEIPDSEFGKWINIYIDFDLKNSMLTVSFNNVRKSKNLLGLSELKTYDIIFGACSNPKFQNTDIAPMTLNNIVITDDEKKIFRQWKLTKHGSNEVYDEVKNDLAAVKNGIWLIDKHVKWTKNASLHIPNLVGMAKNTSEELVYLIGQNQLIVFNIQTQDTDTIPYTSGCPFNNYYNYFIYNPGKKRIISYDYSEKYLNEFDFASRSWMQSSFEYKEPDFAHHNVVISPLDSQLTTFGGYGHYSYKGQIMKFQSLDTLWKSQDVSDVIFPRYLSAAGLDENNNWLIFGGYGSKSGRQEVSPEFYYDLYSYDFKNEKITKIQEYKSPELPFVPCEALVKLPEANSFYTLVYNTSNFTTSLRLAEFYIDVSEYVLFPDVIPFEFLDIESWCMFFLHQPASELVAVTAHKNDVAIYTLAYPALTELQVQQTSKSNLYWLILSLCVCFVGISAVFLFFVFKRNSKSDYEQAIKRFFLKKTTSLSLTVDKQISTSAIYFLGGFQVFEKNGNDISALFTPTLKQLFIIILLNTVKNKRGISTNKLSQTLWFDKSVDSARNNRNVSLSKLRVLLEKIGAIDIEQDSSYLRINMSDVYSDYIEIIKLCEQLRANDSSLDEDEILHFVQIAYRGELLPEFQTEWLDEFKADFSNLVLDTLFDFSSHAEIKRNLPLLNCIAECILKYDSINEEAISMKCQTLYKLGKRSLAKAAFDNFSREYQNLLDTPFPVSFNQIIDKKD